MLAASARLAVAQPAPAPNTTPAPGSPTLTPAPPTPGATDAGKPSPQQKLDDWDAKTSDFDKLRTPDSPAFVILGVSPTEIQRPTTPKGVATTMGGFASGADVTIPKNYALEVAPYWLFAHPDLDVRHYRQDRWQRLYRTFSVSLGTAQATRTTMDAMGMAVSHTDSDLGIGARTILWQDGSEDECTKQANAYGEQLASAVLLSEAEKEAIEKAHPFGKPGYDEAIQQTQQAKADQAVKSFAKTPTCVAAAASAKGLSVEAAGALDVHFADSKVTRGNTSLIAHAVWLSASYDFDNLAIAGMVRYGSRDTTTGRQRVLDGGVRGIYKAKTFALSSEGLVRYRMDAPDDRSTYKVDVSVEYEVRGDTWISMALGKNFSFAPGDVGSLFSLANLKFGLGKPKIGRN